MDWELCSQHLTSGYIPVLYHKFIGDVKGKKVLDLGCGEGGYSRELAKRGAELVSIDCSKKAIEYATKLACDENLQIQHFVRNSNDLFDIASEQFDIVMCSMMLMDCEDFKGNSGRRGC